MKNLFTHFIKEEEGQDLIEYSLLAALIAVSAVVLITATGTAINGIFTKVNTELTTAS